MTMRLRSIVLGVSGTLLLAACSMAGVVKFSAPFSDGAPLPHGLLHVAELSVSIKPLTYHVPFASVGPLVPMVPIGQGNDFGRSSSRLRVVVQFSSGDAEYALEPAGVVYSSDGSEHRPIAVLGPLARNDHPREVARAIPGHRWTCNASRDDTDQTVLADQPLPFKGDVCFELQFDVATPDTESQFSIDIRGLTRDGAVITVPKVQFQAGTTTTYGVMG
jgi:hypothetical protein